MTVCGSGASAWSSTPSAVLTWAAFVAGSAIRSMVRFTADESRGVPSWNFTSFRNVKVYFLASFSTVHFVASHGLMFRSGSRATSESKRSPVISTEPPCPNRGGSRITLSSACVQVSVPPRFAAAVAAAEAPADAVGAVVAGVQAASAAAAATVPVSLRNSRRFSSLDRCERRDAIPDTPRPFSCCLSILPESTSYLRRCAWPANLRSQRAREEHVARPRPPQYAQSVSARSLTGVAT